MKKLFIFVTMFVGLLGVVVYNQVDRASQNQYVEANTLVASVGNKEHIKLKEDIDKKMLLIFKNIKKRDYPTDESVLDLTSQIETLRGFGGDINDKSRVILEQLTTILKQKEKNSKNIIEKLEIMSKSSVNKLS